MTSCYVCGLSPAPYRAPVAEDPDPANVIKAHFCALHFAQYFDDPDAQAQVDALRKDAREHQTAMQSEAQDGPGANYS